MRWCIISDGESREYLCPVERREEGIAMLEAIVEFWENEPGEEDEVPPEPDFVREIEGTGRLTFLDPQESS